MSLGSEAAPDPPQLRRRHRPRQLRAQPAGGAVRDAVRGRGRQQRAVHRQHARGAGVGGPGAERRGDGEGLGRQPRRHALRRHLRRLAHPRSPSFGDNDLRRGRRRPAALALVLLVARTLGRPVAAARPRARRATTSSPRSRRPARRSPATTSTGTRTATRCTPPPAGTSMAAPAAAGSAALVLEAYRQRYGSDPAGASGVDGLTAPALRAPAGGADEQRRRRPVRVALDPDHGRGHAARLPADARSALHDLLRPGEDRHRPDRRRLRLVHALRGAQRRRRPVRRPARRGRRQARTSAGRSPRCATASSRTARPRAAGSAAGTGPRDLQGSWQVGSIAAGIEPEPDVRPAGAAPRLGPTATFRFQPGNPSDGSRAIPPATGPGGQASGSRRRSSAGSDVSSSSRSTVPKSAAPGLVHRRRSSSRISYGQTLRIPVFAAVALHDPNRGSGQCSRAPGARRLRARRVRQGRHDLALGGRSGRHGAEADWLVFPVELAAGLDRARVQGLRRRSRGDETYDLYLYEADLDLLASTHPFARRAGVTDVVANNARGPSTRPRRRC